MTELIVIYDGHCRFCKASLYWLQKKLPVTVIAYQDAALSSYGLTSEQCAKEVHVVTQNQSYAGAAAVAFLLKSRGNSITSFLIRRSGRLGELGYRWVASHRDSLLVRLLTKILERN